MATIKSYTDIEQSKKLAEILPLESADYCWGIDVKTLHYNSSPYPCAWKDYSCKEYYIPCWSLAALLDVLPSAALDSSNDHHYRLYCMERFTEWYDNAVDACYEMIIKLKEKNLL